jgi:protein involved in polysaccharide export with SLBB domain
MIKVIKTFAVLIGFALATVGISLWAQQPDRSRPRRQARPLPKKTAQSAPKAPAEGRARPAYVVEPPDLLLVEVLEALPGRPISGERLVRPDGSISLGFYGDIPVAGLTIPEIKEKVVLHLRKFLNDETLGLIEIGLNSGEPIRDPKTNKIKELPPRETDRVFIDVTGYNSAWIYLEGELNTPGQISYTGGDDVLDLISHAGGLLPSADRTKIRLVRSFPKGSPARILPVDYEEIMFGTDASTNYPTLPNDRLVVPRDPSYVPESVSDAERPSRPHASEVLDRVRRKAQDDPATEKSTYFDRKPSRPRADKESSELEQRVSQIESKLDKLIEMMESEKEKANGKPSMMKMPGEPPLEPDPIKPEESDVRRMLPEAPNVPAERDPFEMVPAVPSERDPFHQLEEPNVRGTDAPPAPAKGATGGNPGPSPRRMRPERSRRSQGLRRPPSARRAGPQPSPGGTPAPAKAERSSEPPPRKNPPQARSPFDNLTPDQ